MPAPFFFRGIDDVGGSPLPLFLGGIENVGGSRLAGRGAAAADDDDDEDEGEDAFLLGRFSQALNSSDVD